MKHELRRVKTLDLGQTPARKSNDYSQLQLLKFAEYVQGKYTLTTTWDGEHIPASVTPAGLVNKFLKKVNNK